MKVVTRLFVFISNFLVSLRENHSIMLFTQFFVENCFYSYYPKHPISLFFLVLSGTKDGTQKFVNNDLTRMHMCVCLHTKEFCATESVWRSSDLFWHWFVSFLLCLRQGFFSAAACARVSGQWTHMESPVSASHLPTGVLGLKTHATTLGLKWLLGIWTQVLTFLWQALYPLSHFPSQPVI